MNLSAVLAVRNEELMLERCLALLGFCDEIVVVIDARTTDGTEAIARRHTDRVWVEAFEDFSQHKNAAIAKARGDWLLIVDADERITPALAREIQETLARKPDQWGFWIDTINYFLGGRMRHGAWNDDHLRLIRRERAVYRGRIHEYFDVPPERAGKLREGMWHFSHRSIEDMLAKTVRFGEVQARELYETGAPKVTPMALARVMGREFGFRMVRQRAWKDGMPGIIEAIYQPFSLFCVHVMLWQLQRRDSLRESYEALERAASEHR
jgi:glycosyltransferase involved in cell wall biosynthesis